MQRIADQAELARAIQRLTAREPVFGRLIALTGPPGLRTGEPGFRGLIRIIVEQMISLKAAAAIWARMEDQLSPLEPESLSRRRVASLRKAGLSTAKANAIRTIAKAVAQGALDLEAIAHAPDEEAMARLTAFPGIGPWTAEIYLLFCLGRADIWPAGDVALQHAVHVALGLEKRPDARAMRDLAESWRPWRGPAALVFWNYYRHLRNMPQA